MKMYKTPSPFAGYSLALTERDHTITPWIVGVYDENKKEMLLDLGFWAYESEPSDERQVRQLLTKAVSAVNRIIMKTEIEKSFSFR